MKLLIAALFFAVAGWFFVDPDTGAPPVEPTPAFDHSLLEVGPPRTRMHDPATTRIGGIEQRCTDCHGLFPAQEKNPNELKQHTDLVQDHGMNDRCFNCHAKDDRQLLVGPDDRLIGYDQVEQLCGKCHGLVFRDWRRGTHGRTNGSWDAASGLQKRLVCTDCHDPHAPAYAPIAPLPGPHTLRMGEGKGEEREHSPLDRFGGHADSEHGGGER